MSKTSRLTQRTEKGAALILDNPKNDYEAQQQVTEKFKQALNKLADYEDKEEKGLLRELPFVAMVEQEITADCDFNIRSASKNGRTAVVYLDRNKGFNLPLIDITDESYKYDTAKKRIKQIQEQANE